jgi:phytoene desaturase
MARVVVVGAGVGGLSAAARLAAGGHDVTVCEAAGRVGGKLASVTTHTAAGTFRFDVGPTLLTLPQVFEALFAATGDPLADVLELRPLDPILRYRFADGSEVDTVSDVSRQVQLFDDALGAGTGAAWRGLLDRGAAMWRAVEDPVFGAALTPRTALTVAAQLRSAGDLRALASGRSLRRLARATLADPRQRLMLERYATYEGSDPRRAPAVLAVVPYVEQAFGGWSVSGGLHRLSDALADRVAQRGGRIRLGTRVDRIETAGSRVDRVVLADGGSLPADVVVCNADATQLYGTLITPSPRRVPPADSFSGFVLMLGLRDRTPGMARHTVLFGRDPYDAEFDAVFGRPGRLVDDPVLYVHAPDDRECAPVGHEAWYVLVNAARHGPDGERGTLDWDVPGRAETYADHVVALLAARGMDVRDRIAFRIIRTPADLERDTGAPGGSIYGRVLHGTLGTFRRPTNRTRIGGLYLVGGSTHPGGGLPLVAMSGKIVADLVGGVTLRQ